MRVLPLYFSVPDLEKTARELARRHGFVLQHGEPAEGEWLLLTPYRLELHAGRGMGAVCVDFAGGKLAHRQRFGGGRGQAIARAAGLKQGKNPSVIDATAGLGRDAFVLASLGSEVILLERSPVVAALLEDGLQRAAGLQALIPIISRMELRTGQAAGLLKGLSADVVYLDPMYPHREKAALVKKEMRIFRELVGEDADAGELLPLALHSARQRVVIKRPAYAPPLAGMEPSMAITTRNHRFDVYVKKALRFDSARLEEISGSAGS